MQSIKQKWAMHRTYKRVRKLWEEYKEVSELNTDRKEVMQKLGAFFDAFLAAYNEYAAMAEEKGLQLDKVYGDCTGILLALLDILDRISNLSIKNRESANINKDSKDKEKPIVAAGEDVEYEIKDTGFVGEIVEKALSVAEVILHDEKYRVAVKQTPNVVERVLSLLDTLRSTETKMRALHLIVFLSQAPGGRIEIGRLDGFRKMFRLLFEGDDELKREILRTLQHFLVVAGDEGEQGPSTEVTEQSMAMSDAAANAASKMLTALDSYAAASQPGSSVSAPNGGEAADPRSVGALQFVRSKVINVVRELGRVFLPEMMGAVASFAESGGPVPTIVQKPESVSAYPPSIQALATIYSEIDAEINSSSKMSSDNEEQSSKKEKEEVSIDEDWVSVSHKDTVVDSSREQNEDLLASNEDADKLTKEFMCVQGALGALAHSLREAKSDIQLDMYQMISRLLFKNRANQSEFVRINGYSLLLQAFDRAATDYSATKDSGFINHVFDIFIAIALDGNKLFLVRNLDALKLLVSFVCSSQQMHVRIKAVSVIRDLISANPLNVAAIERVGGIKVFLDTFRTGGEFFSSLDSVKDKEKENGPSFSQFLGIKRQQSDSCHFSFEILSTANIDHDTKKFLLLLQQLFEFIQVTKSVRDCNVMIELVHIIHNSDTPPYIRLLALQSLSRLVPDLLSRNICVPHELLDCVADILSFESSIWEGCTLPNDRVKGDTAQTSHARQDSSDSDTWGDLDLRPIKPAQVASLSFSLQIAAVLSVADPLCREIFVRRRHGSAILARLARARVPVMARSVSEDFSQYDDEIEPRTSVEGLMPPSLHSVSSTGSSPRVSMDGQKTSVLLNENENEVFHLSDLIPGIPRFALSLLTELVLIDGAIHVQPSAMKQLVNLIDSATIEQSSDRKHAFASIAEACRSLRVLFTRSLGVPKAAAKVKKAFASVGGITKLYSLLEIADSNISHVALSALGLALSGCETAKARLESISDYSVFIELVKNAASFEISEEEITSSDKIWEERVNNPLFSFEFLFEVAVTPCAFSFVQNDVDSTVGLATIDETLSTIMQPKPLLTEVLPISTLALKPDMKTSQAASSESTTKFETDDASIGSESGVSSDTRTSLVPIEEYFKPSGPSTAGLRFRNMQVALALLEILPTFEPIEQREALHRLLVLCETNPDCSRSLCSTGGIKWLFKFMETCDEDVITSVLDLVAGLGSYDICLRDAHFLTDLASLCGGKVPTDLAEQFDATASLPLSGDRFAKHQMQLMAVIGQIAERSGAAEFFHFDGMTGGMVVPAPDKFPSAKTGLNMCLWIKIRAFPAKKTSLISFADRDGTLIFDVSLEPSTENSSWNKRLLRMGVYNTNSEMEYISLNKIWFESHSDWHHVAISHRKGSVVVHLDGDRLQSVNMAYLVITAGKNHWSLLIGGLNTTKDGAESCPFAGDLGSIHFLEGKTSSAQWLRCVQYGPAYSGSLRSLGFENREFLCISPRSITGDTDPFLQSSSPVRNTPINTGVAETPNNLPPSTPAGSFRGASSDQNVSVMSPTRKASGIVGLSSPVGTTLGLSRAIGTPVFGSTSQVAEKSVEVHGTAQPHVTNKLKVLLGNKSLLLFTRFLVLGRDQRVAGLRILSSLLQDYEPNARLFEQLSGYSLIYYILSSGRSLSVECFDALFEFATEVGYYQKQAGDEASQSTDFVRRDSKALRNPLAVLLILQLIKFSEERVQESVIRVLSGYLLTSSTSLSLWRGNTIMQSENSSLVLGVPALIHLMISLPTLQRSTVLEVFRRLISVDPTASEVQMILDFAVGSAVWAESSGIEIAEKDLDIIGSINKEVVNSVRFDILRILLNVITNNSTAALALIQHIHSAGGFLLLFSLLGSAHEDIRMLGIQLIGILLESGSSKTVASFSKLAGFDTMVHILTSQAVSVNIIAAVLGVAVGAYQQATLHDSSSRSATMRQNDHEPTMLTDNTILVSTSTTDSSYSSQTVVHPHCIRAVLELFQHCEVACRDHQQLKLLNDLEKLMNKTSNMDSLWEKNFLAWAWDLIRVLQEQYSQVPDPTTEVLGLQVRAIVRRMLLYGLGLKSGSFEAQLRDMAEAEQFQLLAIGDVADTWEANPLVNEKEAPVLVKNLATLFRHVEELHGFTPMLAVRIINAISVVALRNTPAVRQLMSAELFEIRDELIFTLLRSELPDFQMLVDARSAISFETTTTQQRFRESNGMLYLLRLFLATASHIEGSSSEGFDVEKVNEIDRVSHVQTLLCETVMNAVATHEDNQRALARFVEDKEILRRLCKLTARAGSGSKPRPRNMTGSGPVAAMLNDGQESPISTSFTESANLEDSMQRLLVNTSHDDSFFLEEEADLFIEWLFAPEQKGKREALSLRVEKLSIPVDASHQKLMEKARAKISKRARQRQLAISKSRVAQMKTVSEVFEKKLQCLQRSGVGCLSWLRNEVKSLENLNREGLDGWKTVSSDMEKSLLAIAPGQCCDGCSISLKSHSEALLHRYLHHVNADFLADVSDSDGNEGEKVALIDL